MVLQPNEGPRPLEGLVPSVERAALRGEIDSALGARAERIAVDPELTRQRLREDEGMRFTRLSNIATTCAAPLSAARTVIQGVRSNDESRVIERNKLQIDQIIDGILEQPPGVGENGPRTRYVYKERIQAQGADEPIFTYKVDMTRIYGPLTGGALADIPLIDQMIIAFNQQPEAVAALRTIKEKLLQIAQTDPIAQEYQAREAERADRPAARAFGQMGRLAALCGIGAWTVLSGVVGRSVPGVAIGAGAMMLVANPGFLRPADQRRLEVGNTLTQDPAFQALLRRYSIHGTPWAQAAETLATMPDARFRALTNAVQNAEANGEVVRDFLNDVPAGVVRTTCLSMVTDMAIIRSSAGSGVVATNSTPALLAFASYLRASRDREVRRYMVDVIRERRVVA